MKNKIPKATLNALNSTLVVLIVGCILSVAYLIAQKSSPKIHNSTGVNQQINYQGRLLTSTGAVVPDGTYNMEFKISQDGDGVLGGGDETLKWTETRIAGDKVQVKNGYFSVYLGSITAFGSSVDWDQDTLWLSINIGGTGLPSWDGEMTPFTRFSSTPYSLNSRALGGLTSDNYIKLAQGAQGDSSVANSSIFINKTAISSNILQLQRNSLDVLLVANDGSTTFKNSTNSPNAFQIQNQGGTELFGVDTSNNTVNILGASNPSLRSWSATTGIGADKSEGGFVTANGYIYAIGSSGGGSPSAGVYYSRINADGTLGTWSTTSSLNTARWGSPAVVGNGYIYIVGGNDGSASDSVEYAKINADGTLGTWTATSSLGTARYRHNAVSVNGYVYAIGGPGLSSVEYAKINADGTLGSWNTTSSLLGIRYGEAVVSANGYIYVLGGNSGSGDLATTEAALINSNGTLGSWGSNTSMGTAQNIVNAVVVNGYVYTVGGCGAAGCPSNQVQYASIGNNGVLGTWATTSILGTSRYGNGAVVANGYIYALSGAGNTSVEYTSIERVRIGGALDLVGLSGGNLADGQTGVGGELTAGNTKIIGGLDVQGQVSLARALSVGSDITVGGTAISGAADLTVRSAGSTALNLIGDGGVYVDSFGSQIFIGTQGSLQDVTVGNSSSSSATRLWAGTSGVTVQPGSNTNTAFQIKNSGNVTLFGLDTNNSRIFSDVVDGVSAVGLRFNTNNSFSTSGAKLFSLQNNGSEKFFVDKDGLVNGQGGLTISGGTASINTSANSTSIGNGSSILALTGSSSSNIVLGGTTISAAELNLLDGHNVALVDTDDGVNTAITGTGILGAGSIASGFGAIDVGTDGITTTGTIGTAGSTTFTGNTLTLTGALAANGGITFNNSTDTLGAFTLAGTLDASTQLITNIGNAGTDFTSAGGLNLASDLNVTGDAYSSHRVYVPGLSGTNGQGFFTGTSTTTLGGLQSLDLAANTYTFFGNNKYYNGSAWVDNGLSRTGSSFQIQNDSFTFYSFDTGVVFTPRFTVASGGNVGIGVSGAPASLLSVGGSTGNFLVNSAGDTSTVGNLDVSGLSSFHSSVGSTGAFQVQNSSGLDILNVNTATTPNLVSNSSFENNANGWSKKGNAGVAITSSDEVATTFGARELKIVTTANANDGATFNFTPLPSTAYSITFWAKSTASTGANISFGHRENSGTGDVNCLTGQTLTTTWTQFTCTNYTTNATVNDPIPTVGIYVKQSDATSRTIYIDGVTMVQSATALNFDSGGSLLDLQSLNGGVTINSSNSGELQPWQTNSNSLNGGTALRHSSTASSNGYVYSIGGCTGACGAGTAVTTVQYAKVSSNGAVGTWSTTTALPAALYGHTSFQANGYVYAVGGDSGAGAFGANPQTNIYYAKLKNDGTIGAWQTGARTLPAAREFHSTVFNGGFAYVIGGDNAGAQSTVYYAKMYADGSTGDWSTTTPLTTGGAARRYASAVYANGFMYLIGGDTGGTAQTSVYYNSMSADGTLGASWATTTSLPSARRWQSSVLANGYVYAIGGDNAGAQNSTYYAKLLADGTVGSWTNNTNALPSAVYGQASTAMNGYVYSIGGYNGTSASANILYSSTSRVLLGGTLDLVGLSSQYLSDPGGAGAIVAGNIRAIGGLQVEGFADINGGLSVDSALNINAVSANTGQIILNINNSSSNSIFSVLHMAPNFGSLATAGAFVDNNSTYRQEFASDIQTGNSTADGTTVGDDGQWYTDLSTVGSVSSWNQGDVAGGVVRLNTGTISGRGVLLGFGFTNGNLSTVLSKARLPVVQMKVKAGINSTTNDFFWGMMDQATAVTANDTKPANGIYFWNNNAAGGWQGVVRSGAADVGTVNCPGAVSTTQFAVGRIQVESASSVRFLIDNDASDGVTLVDCGVVGVNTNPTAALGLASYVVHTETTGRTFEIDYMSFWQDDDAPLSEVANGTESQDSGQGLEVEAQSETFDSRIALADIMASADNTYDPSRRFDIQTLVASGGIVARDITTDKLSVNNIEVATGSDINMKLSEDGKFVISGGDGEQKITFDGQGNANFAGTITADKIKASQIEGLEIFTNRISAVPTSSSQLQPEPETTETEANNNTQSSAPAPVQFGDITINSAKVTLNIDVNGIITTAGLTVNGPSEFHGNTTFYKLVTFVEKTVFNNDIDFVGRATFNNDTAGFAVIQPGQTQVHVDFTRPYDQLPVVTLSVKNGQFVQYAYRDLTDQGFTIVIEQPATTPVEFSWNALSVKNARTSSNP